MPRAERQRIRFDLTRHELVVDPPEMREVFHGYSDAPDPVPRVRCYSMAEVLAEKVRALQDRLGRARDVYDVVNVGRNLREEISAAKVAEVADQKFRFKELEPPTPEKILARVDPEVLETDWTQALRHQLPLLPPVHDFLDALKDVLEWIFAAAPPALALSAVPGREGERSVPPVRFTRRGTGRGIGHPRATPPFPWPSETFGSRMDRVRYAARNRLLARVTYHGVPRLIEPYSLRVPRTGNLLLYVHEVQRGGAPGGGVKAFKVSELGEVQVTDQPFRARYLVEL